MQNTLQTIVATQRHKQAREYKAKREKKKKRNDSNEEHERDAYASLSHHT